MDVARQAESASCHPLQYPRESEHLPPILWLRKERKCLSDELLTHFKHGTGLEWSQWLSKGRDIESRQDASHILVWEGLDHGDSDKPAKESYFEFQSANTFIIGHRRLQTSASPCRTHHQSFMSPSSSPPSRNEAERTLPLVISAEVARHVPERLLSLGRHELRGARTEAEVFTLAELLASPPENVNDGSTATS